MNNIVKNVDNRGGIINQTTIKKYFVLKPKKWLQKTFQKQKYYQDITDRLAKQLSKKIEVQKINKKYIPDIFLELNKTKESLRYITQPILFYEKDFNEIRNIEFYHFNELLERLKLDKKELIIEQSLQNPKSLNELEENCKKLQDIFEKFKKSIPNMRDKETRHKIKKNLSKEEYGLFALSQALDLRFNSMTEPFEKNFDLLTKKFILLTEKAGQGKTNLICDFAEKVILKKNLFGVMFTGNEFNNFDRDNIEDVILKDIYSFGAGSTTFDEFLDDVEYLCKQQNATFTILIDGLNENSNLEKFSEELYRFVEKILEKDYIRLIFTCRSEYFDERFHIFKEPSFKDSMVLLDNYMKQYHGEYHNERLEKYLEDRLIDAYFKFFRVENNVFDNVRQQLVLDFLLLRIFSEVYGKNTNINASTEQVYDIYKDDLFKQYFEFKKEQIVNKTSYTLTDFQKLFEIVLKYMIDNHQYLNISFESLDGINMDLLNHIIDEDIFFRKDLIKDESSTLGNKEVLNFTFDEFRDYLLADYLVNSDIGIEYFITSIDDNDTSIEGIEKYLFFKSRKHQYRDQLNFLEDLEYYDDLFLDNIFSVKDEDITDKDIKKIKELFMLGYDFSKDIIHFLMFRHDTHHYKKLNIMLLNEIIFSLNEEKYNELVNPKFEVREEYGRERKGYILWLCNQLEDVLKKFDTLKSKHHNIIQFTFLLLGVTDESKYGSLPHEVIDFLKKYIEKYPKNAKEILLKYYNIDIEKVKINIWKLFNYYVEKQVDLDSEFCQMIFDEMNKIEDLSPKSQSLKSQYQYFLKKCFRANNELFTDEQKDFFEQEKKEAKRRLSDFQAMPYGDIDFEDDI